MNAIACSGGEVTKGAELELELEAEAEDEDEDEDDKLIV